MIVVTGSSGFIGKAYCHRQRDGRKIETCDTDKVSNYSPDAFLEALAKGESKPEAVVHLGACTDTTCHDRDLLDRVNTAYTKRLFEICTQHGVRLIYASSAATYGDGSSGFSDDHAKLAMLKPLNPYGESKHLVDVWAIERTKEGQCPPNWAALKFFNVYGEGEWHKGKMASVVFQAMGQVVATGKVRLFKYGEQSRDWVFVDDVCDIIDHMLQNPCQGIYNVGSGIDRSFNDVATAAFDAVGKPKRVEFFDMPESLCRHYQSYSKADISKLRNSGFAKQTTSLEDGTKKISSQWEEWQHA